MVERGTADSGNDHRIVVGVDGSEPSKHALRWAVRQAELTGAWVDVINAWEVPPLAGVAPILEIGAESTALARAGEQTLAESVAEVAGGLPPAPIRTRVVHGPPAVALLQAAEGADLLVLGCRGHGGFIGALLGSVSQYCVQHADCPVVVTRGTHCTDR
ncbi:universal stress protein [Planosporangium mesophilum]|nr:universal stress protein [Planosporangium mesophilum]NJC84685.1 universal stress protein [Planosporangium mesophilum]